jgi:Na+-driven multidrug efflux pump
MGIVYLAVGVCFTLGLSNIVPQAVGAKEYKLCGAYLNRMIICVLSIFGPLLLPMMFINKLFEAMGQNAQVVEMATIYVRFTCPGIMFYFLGQAHCNFAAAMGRQKYMLMTTAGSSVFHWILT